jgi:hypothetical protein
MNITVCLCLEWHQMDLDKLLLNCTLNACLLVTPPPL